MEEIAELLPTQTTRHSVKKHAILVQQGEVPTQAYVVLHGAFKAYRLSHLGEEQVVGFRAKGDIFPETWIFGKTTTAMCFFEALEDSEVLSVERSVFLELIDTHPKLKQEIFDYMTSSYTGMLVRVTALEQHRAADKILLLMCYLMFCYGKETKPGVYTVDLQLTHTTLGGLTGLTRETTTVELGRLKRKNIIQYDSKRFVIYRHALERELGDESLPDIKL